MATEWREFRFVGSGASKFWAIALEGSAHTVRFGRIGSAGQERRKDFAGEAEARRSYDRLIAEKLREGYLETGTGDAVPAAAAAPAPSPAAPAPSPAPPASEASAALPGVPDRRVDLDPVDWRVATWRRLPPLELPSPRPFDREACLAAVRRIPRSQYGWLWQWEALELPAAMSPEEARFWYQAMTTPTRLRKPGPYDRWDRREPAEVVDELAAGGFEGAVTVDDVRRRTASPGVDLGNGELARVLLSLLGPSVLELVDLGEEEERVSPAIRRVAPRTPAYLRAGLQRHVLPYLPEGATGALRERLRPLVHPDAWPDDRYVVPFRFHLAAMLGLSVELAAVVESWPDDLFSAAEDWGDHYWEPQTVVFGLGSAEEVEHHVRRLRLRLKEPRHVRGWLVHTEWRALDVAGDSVAAVANREERDELAAELARVHAPEAAPQMLRLQGLASGPPSAGRWLDGHLELAAAGLVPAAAGRGQLADAAAEHLREMLRRGHEALVRGMLATADAEVRERVAAVVIAPYEAETRTPVGPAPPALAAALAEARQQRLRTPAWIEPATLPALLVEGGRLAATDVATILAALRQSEMGRVHPVAGALRAEASRPSLDAFAWRLFERWQAAGGAPREKWAMGAVGWLGSDALALRLAPLVRTWPGESQHQRAVLGLECLRAIGTDGALMQLSGIAQRVKFKGLQAKAVACMDEIAGERGMSRAELEDRIVPDCELDERGRRVFEVGARRFEFVLRPDLRPALRDESGRVRDDLPKGAGTDDAGTDPAAEWRLMKKQVREVAKIQAERLEQAMVTGRRWRRDDFERLLVRHPLMTHLVRLLVWGWYGEDGALEGTFRVEQRPEYLGPDDGPLELPDHPIGVVHPLQLPEPQAAAWGRVFADYELLSPFPQLGRPVHELTPAERGETRLNRLAFRKVAAATLVGNLERLGWSRGPAADGGVFSNHWKHFHGSGLTAVVEYEIGVPMGALVDWEDQQVTGAFFLPGIRKLDWYQESTDAVRLDRIDPVVVSEVLRDLGALAR